MNKRRFANFHSHKTYTNPIIADCPLDYNDYIKRAIELGQTVITSVEHGFQGNYWLLNELIRNKNIEFAKRRLKGESNVPEDLKFVFGAEAYWVKDRHQNDRSNCHKVILAKNENGRQEINYALSIANEDGMFDGRPRLDLELLMSLPEDDVFITTACIGYWNKYDDIEEITVKLFNKFKHNFMLEVQNHNTEKQKELNKKILEISKKYGIEIICGLDTHVINIDSPYSDNDIKRRDKILEYKGIKYPDEEGWYMDYPDVETIIKRFEEQGVLSRDEIDRAIDNTLIIESFEEIDLGLKTIIDGDKMYLDAEVKVPNLYKDKSMQERCDMFKKILNDEWCKFAREENIPKEEYPKYLDGIRYEAGEIMNSGMVDYFLLHYKPIKNGVKKYGGKITKRGRGSGVSYFSNTLLGFSKVDRFKTPIKLYPERFITADRILKAKAIPDLDNNIDRQEPFVKAFRDELGEHGIYPMIAFGALKKSSAIKLYMGAEGVEASIQNEVTKQLKEYDKAIKHCETEEEKEHIDIADYIDKKYHKYIELSKPYQGIIIQKSQHPCAHLVFDGDIRREVGLFRCESKTTKKSVLTACIEGTMADHYKYLKTDLLIVDVVGLTEAIWERIGEQSPSNTKLEQMLKTEKGQKAWDMYARGLTLCVNQCEQEGTKNKCKRYKMKNTSELASFVSAVRPGFASQLNNFLDRKPYTNGVKELDELFSDSQKYILFQENIMGFLGWLGIDMKETYEIVKKISKKVYTDHPEQMEELKNRCRPMWIKHVGSEEGFDRTFKVVELSGQYIFNASHAYCVGLDGAEIAYCKANYPFETYEVCLNWFNNKKNKDKVSALQQEMKVGFGINVGELKWGKNNTKFTLDKENNCIYPCLNSIKGMGKDCPKELYDLSQKKKYNSFFELIIDIKEHTSLDNSMLEDLIKLNYFDCFGKSQKLLKVFQLFDAFYKKEKGFVIPKKQFKKDNLPSGLSADLFRKYSERETEKQFTKVDNKGICNEIEGMISNRDIPLQTYLDTQQTCLGYIDYKNPKLDKKYVLVTDVNTKYTPVIKTQSLGSGVAVKCKISKKIWENLEVGNIIYINSMEKKFGFKKVGEDENGKPKFEKDESKQEWWITNYSIINSNIDFVLEELNA